jgi:hypothetical protein
VGDSATVVTGTNVGESVDGRASGRESATGANVGDSVTGTNFGESVAEPSVGETVKGACVGTAVDVTGDTAVDDPTGLFVSGSTAIVVPSLVPIGLTSR